MDWRPIGFAAHMAISRSDFRENARKVLYAFAETPEADISSVAKALGFSFVNGSRAKGTARTDSDYDVFVIGNEGLQN